MAFFVICGIGLFFWMCVWFFRQVGKETKINNANPEQTFDELFDGTPHVSYRVHMASIPYDKVVIGAAERGYELASDSGADRYGTQTLVFKKTDSGLQPDADV